MNKAVYGRAVAALKCNRDSGFSRLHGIFAV